MRTDVLEEIGLTKTESNVYLALLELGSSTTGKIVDKSKSSSSKIYEILDKLMQKGLVSFIIKSGVKYFEAAPPERIMDYMKEKEKKFNQQKDELKKILPELELKQKLSKYNSEATIFKGLKGGETAFRYMIDSMTKKDEWIGFVISFQNRRYFDLLTKLHEWRAKKGLRSRIIFNEKDREDGKAREKLHHTKVKYIPNELQTPAIVNVAGNITLINIMAEEVTVFMIESNEVADSFRNQFEKLWNQEAQVLKGLDAVQHIFEEMLEYDKVDFIGARGYFVDLKPKYVDEWEKRAIKKGFKMRNIVDPGIKGHRITSFPFVKTKYTLPKEFSQLSVFWIYGNRVVITNWMEKEPIVIVIENKNLYNMYKQQFELLWKKDKF